MSNDFDLARIRVGTMHDLADAQELVKQLLSKATAGLDRVSTQFSYDLLTAISLHLAYQNKAGNLIDVLDYFDDPRWDVDAQKFSSIGCVLDTFQPEAKRWAEDFLRSKSDLGMDDLGTLIKRCRLHLSSVGKPTGNGSKRRAKTRGCIQVFGQEALDKAVVGISEVKEGLRAMGERILQNAHANGGSRTLPDAKRAMVKLEAAKSRFENLVEPLGRLQMDLILSAAMKPQEFRVSPLLLLGDPGIGKTFLATQLAEALGVASEKISAGGAQAGFQFTGSHRSWTSSCPGLLFTLLAEGGSATPVVVIDEVDKIRDSNFPVLPVLLDVLDADTAKQFKDEFFEMQFDASRIIFVLTANSLDGVPPSLLSRVEVFNVPPPEPKQRLRIILATAEKLRQKTKRQIALDAGTCEMLSARVDIDLRRVTRLVNEAFARTMQAGERVARIVIPDQVGKRSIGFHTAYPSSIHH
ncbi:AAA family ATPase [Propionivibrio sp.]|uniref:AAA family ATPase n=1 Tax=Propionivibrio sp. TaxID=2212460 RepID=UPI003BF09931